MKDILYQFNPWWEGSWDQEWIERASYLSLLEKDLDTKDVVLLTGLRRIGKTTLLKLMIRRLLLQGIPRERIFYFSLDFYGVETVSIRDLVNEFRKIHNIHLTERIYVFLDEVAARATFHQELKNLYDLENIKIFASSSSASVLKDKKAYLTGRTRVVEVMPLSFAEYLLFKKVVISTAEKYLLEKWFEKYLEEGGIPEYVLTGDPHYIVELLDNILYKDIIAHHNLKDPKLVRDFFRILMERAGKQASLSKIAKVLGVSPDTARRYLAYFEDSYLVYTMERCGKLNKRLTSPRKLYAGDVGLRSALTGFRDKGAMFENLVFLNIRNRRPCYVLRDGHEIDFLTEDKTLIEVKYHSEMTDKQAKLYADIKAKQKIVITGLEDFQRLE